MTYELWNTRTRNLLGALGTEVEALAVVRDLISERGADYADRLALGVENASGRSRIVASGKALVARAFAVTDHPLIPTR